MASAAANRKECEKAFEETMRTSTTCMPRKRKRGSPPASPTSVLSRLREMFMKIVMFSAVSRADGGCGGGARRSGAVSEAGTPHSHRHLDSYQIEAVEECIEFFRKSASPKVRGGDF